MAGGRGYSWFEVQVTSEPVPEDVPVLPTDHPGRPFSAVPLTGQKFEINMPGTVEIRRPSSPLMRVLEQDAVLLIETTYADSF